MSKNLKEKLAKQYHFEIKQLFGDFENLKEKPTDIIDLSIGDPDLPTDPQIIKEGYEDVMKNGYTHYTPSAGFDDLREEIVKSYNEDYHFNIKKENVFVITSATMGMYVSLKATLDEGDEVLVFSPYYITYKHQIDSFNAKMICIDLKEENDRQVTYEMLKEKVTPKTKGIIVNSPSNPTGTVFNEESLKNIVKIAEEYNLFIYADDVYTNNTYEGEFIPISRYAFDRTFTIRTFSKDFCMTGFRIAYLIIPAEFFALINHINEHISYIPPAICQRIALFSLKERKRILPGVKNEFEKRINYAYERIQKIPFLSCIKPKGANYLFINIKKTGMTSEDFKNLCIEKCHIVLMNGASFGKNGEGYVRISAIVPVEKLKEVFDRIEKLEFK